MTTEQKNKVIAEFDKRMFNGLHINEFTGKLPRMKYHTSFDWLMPVVEKIESLGFNTKIYRMEDGHECQILNIGSLSYEFKKSDIISYAAPFFGEPCRGMPDSKILTIHEAVYQFCNWYLNQKP